MRAGDAPVIATPKHFLGDGGTGGVDQGDNTATESELRNLDAAGYYAAIGAGAQTVMASYSSWRGVRVHGSHALLTEVLKGGWASTVSCSATGTDMRSCPDAPRIAARSH